MRYEKHSLPLAGMTAWSWVAHSGTLARLPLVGGGQRKLAALLAGGTRFVRVRFAYYKRLSAKQKATYRSSDAVDSVKVPDAAELAPLVAQLETSLLSGKRLATAKAASALVLALCRQLDVPPVRLTVRTVRPEISGGELHGLYTYSKKGADPTIEVWMKTAAHERVVRFRTFLRTLLHEVLHHLDVTLLGLEDSFHTEGFFKRESSLVRQLVVRPRAKRGGTKTRGAKDEPQKTLQLALFETGPIPGGTRLPS
jgi:hypothetical protein